MLNLLITVLNGANEDNSSPQDVTSATAREGPTGDSVTNKLSALYHRHVKPIYRYLYSRTGNRQDAEDLTEQVFLDALEGLTAYEELDKEAAWLFTIAHRRAVDFYRRQRKDLPLHHELDWVGEEVGPERTVTHREQVEHLEKLLADLDEEKQELLRLRFAGDLTYREIGKVMNKSEAAVKMSIHRLLEYLRAMWHFPRGDESLPEDADTEHVEEERTDA